MNYEYLVLGSSGLTIILLLVVVWLALRVKRLDALRREFYVDEQPKKIDDVLTDHNNQLKHLGTDLQELGEYVRGLAIANKKNFQKIGFVRFNPFEDAGGSISFVIAVLDADSNGFVISSLHGREGNRVYAKEVHKGISKSQLTEEEKEAINQAV